ncbi:MAG: prepilin-type N-terminal cleavage/methylation domain-containing protein [Patescibacteria group bacterium]
MKRHLHSGFTLLELMLAIAIIAVIAVGAITLDIPAQQRNDLDTVRNSIIQTLHSARTKARAADGDAQWGVSIQQSTFVLFKGASYASRDASYDEATDIPQTLAPSGLGELTFAKRTGDPAQTGSITLTSKTNEQRTITINAKGMIDY